MTIGGICKVLVVSPLYHIHWQSVDAIMGLVWRGWLDRFFPRENPTGDRYADIEYQYRKARAVMLAGDYDAMLTVEADVIVPLDTVTKLAETGAEEPLGELLSQRQH